MSESLLSNVCVVLYEPQDPVNIAATVRAMKNMGVHALRLVRPVPYEPRNLEGIAHGTMDVIERIRTFESFDAAVADCVHLAAFTARRRAARWRLIEPRAAAAATLEHAAEGMTALVFGREDSGLPNDILDRSHAHVTIPTTEHSSLNLAQAALIALYELHLAAGDATRTIAPPRKSAPPPPNADLERYFGDVGNALEAIEFFKTRDFEHIMRTVRSLTYRAAPDARELSLVRAMALEVRNFMKRKGWHHGTEQAQQPGMPRP